MLQFDVRVALSTSGSWMTTNCLGMPTLISISGVGRETAYRGPN